MLCSFVWCTAEPERQNNWKQQYFHKKKAEIILLRDLILHLYTAYMVYLVITPTYFIISKTIERKGKPLVAKMNKSCFFFRTSFLREVHFVGFRCWPWGGLTWRLVGREICAFFLQEQSNLCVQFFSTTVWHWHNAIYQLVSLLPPPLFISLFVSLSPVTLTCPPSFGVIYGVKISYSFLLHLPTLQGFRDALESKKPKTQSFFVPCPEEGIIDGISRSSGGRVVDRRVRCIERLLLLFSR